MPLAPERSRYGLLDWWRQRRDRRQRHEAVAKSARDLARSEIALEQAKARAEEANQLAEELKSIRVDELARIVDNAFRNNPRPSR